MSTPYYYKNSKTLTNQGMYNSSSSDSLELWKFSDLPSEGLWPVPHRYSPRVCLCFCFVGIVSSAWVLCDLLTIFGIIGWHRLWKIATCESYYHFLDKELRGTYSLDGNHQQCSRRRTTHDRPRETGSNSRRCHRVPHQAKPLFGKAATPKERRP